VKIFLHIKKKGKGIGKQEPKVNAHGKGEEVKVTNAKRS